MKNKKKKAFTLVELLAVIVILAVILVIAIPQIMNTIKTARISSFKDSAILIAEQAEKDYLSQQVLNQDYNATSIPCEDVAKLNDDYDSCAITYNNGIATVSLSGKTGGKFDGVRCNGTRDNMECTQLDSNVLGLRYNGELLTSDTDDFWLEIKNKTEARCSNHEYQSSNPYNLTFEAISENSADVKFVYPNETDNLIIQTTLALEADPYTGDIRVVVGECVNNPAFDYTKYTYDGEVLTSPRIVTEYVQDGVCPRFLRVLESLDVECAHKLIGGPTP